MIYKSDIGGQVLEQARCRGAFFRDPNIRVPFNLFANTETLWKVATQKGMNTPPKPTAAWVFSEGAPAGGKAAARLDIPYPQLYKVLSVGWRYDAASGRWLRTLAGKPAIDKADGKQVSAANVDRAHDQHGRDVDPRAGHQAGPRRLPVERVGRSAAVGSRDR